MQIAAHGMGVFRLLWIVAGMAFAFAGSARAGDAVPGTLISRKLIETYPIPGTDEEVQMILVEFPPGAASPRHVHPVVGLNYIIEGEAQSQYEGEAMKTYKAGESYQDNAGMKHVVFRNPSTNRPLRFLIACKIKKGVPFMQPSP